MKTIKFKRVKRGSYFNADFNTYDYRFYYNDQFLTVTTSDKGVEDAIQEFKNEYGITPFSVDEYTFKEVK